MSVTYHHHNLTLVCMKNVLVIKLMFLPENIYSLNCD